MEDTRKLEKNLLRDTPKINKYKEKKMVLFNEHKKKEVGQMSKRLIVLLAVLLAVSFSVPAFAAVQNVKVSGDLLTRGISRTRFTLSDSYSAVDITTPGGEKGVQNNVDAIARLRVDADLTDGVAVTFGTITERLWGQEDNVSGDSDLDLDLAYVTLNDVLNFVTQTNIPLSLTLGRQPLRYGNALVIGDPDANLGFRSDSSNVLSTNYDLSLRKSFDAIKGVLDYDPLVIDLVLAKIDENGSSRFISDNDDITLYGVNANYTGFDNMVLDGYWWLRNRGKGNFAAAAATETEEDEATHVVGLLAQYNGVNINDSPLMMSLEGAYQFGNIVSDLAYYPDIQADMGFEADKSYKRKAFAVQGSLAYTLQEVKYTPTVVAGYTYLSGQQGDSSTGTHQANSPYKGWDPMFEDQGVGTIANALFAASNCHVIKLGATIKPTMDTSLTLDYINARLAKSYLNDATIHVLGLASDLEYTMTDNKNFYQEIDAKFVYDYTEDVQLGLDAGILIPGDAFSDAAYKLQPASQVIGSMKVSF